MPVLESSLIDNGASIRKVAKEFVKLVLHNQSLCDLPPLFEELRPLSESGKGTQKQRTFDA